MWLLFISVITSDKTDGIDYPYAEPSRSTLMASSSSTSGSTDVNINQLHCFFLALESFP